MINIMNEKMSRLLSLMIGITLAFHFLSLILYVSFGLWPEDDLRFAFIAMFVTLIRVVICKKWEAINLFLMVVGLSSMFFTVCHPLATGIDGIIDIGYPITLILIIKSLLATGKTEVSVLCPNIFSFIAGLCINSIIGTLLVGGVYLVRQLLIQWYRLFFEKYRSYRTQP